MGLLVIYHTAHVAVKRTHENVQRGLEQLCWPFECKSPFLARA